MHKDTTHLKDAGLGRTNKHSLLSDLCCLKPSLRGFQSEWKRWKEGKVEKEKECTQSGIMGERAVESIDGKKESEGGMLPFSPRWPRLAEPHNACSTV